MATQQKKSSDNTRKLNGRSICMKALLALIIMLTAFTGIQRTASTQVRAQDPARQYIDGHEVMPGEAIVSFEVTDKGQRQAFVDNAVSLAGGLENRIIGPDNLNMVHFRSKNM